MNEIDPKKNSIEKQSNKTYLTLIGSIVLSFLGAFMGSYFNEKGKNAATKEDIASITSAIKAVEHRFQNEYDLGKIKYQLKYNAILKSLESIDAYYSNKFTSFNGQQLTKQFMTIQETRKIHTELLLTSSDTLCNKYLDILFKTNKDSSMIKLHEYRIIAAKELGFSQSLSLDTSLTFIGSIIFDNK